MSSTVIESMAHEHERDPRCLQILNGLIVRPAQMLANLHRQKDLLATEWLLFRLGKIVGKNKAMDKLHTLAAAAAEQQISLKEAVLADNELGSVFNEEELAPLDSPEQYVGSAVELVDRTVEVLRGKRRQQ